MAKETDTVIIHGQPGSRARFRGVMRASLPLCAALVLCGYAIGVLLPLPAVGLVWKGLMIVVLAFALVLATSLTSQRIDAFFKGAAGEVAAAWALARLPGGYTVFHGVDIADAHGGIKTHDFDHVVLAPGGLVVVETKNWRGAITFDDGVVRTGGIVPSADPVAQVAAEAEALSSWLADRIPDKPEVTPLLCFVGDSLPADAPTELRGVAICSDAALTDAILSRCSKALPMPASAYERISTLLKGKV
ncbi:MAG: NERD domain-containing protein [Kiritimatiellae bacterium]|nr:NERD domain-containing protein [Kiritimatiellia bacterium]